MSNNNHPDKRAEARKKRRRIVRIKYGERDLIYDVTEKKNPPVPVDESYLKEHADENYRRLCDSEKAKVTRRFFKDAKVADAGICDLLPNSGGKIKPADANKHVPDQDDLKHGAGALLQIRHLFPSLLMGYLIVADLLIAMRCSAICSACRGTVRFITEFRSASAELADLLSQLIGLAVTKHHWGGQISKNIAVKIQRDAVLDYRTQVAGRPYAVAQFSEVKVRFKNRKPFRTPASYRDTVALIIGASSSQIKKALQEMTEAVVWAVNSPHPEKMNVDVRKAEDLSFVNTTISDQLAADAPYIRALLRWWWAAEDGGEDNWAIAVVKRARARLKSPGQSDYVILSPNPSKLRHAIRCEVLLAFLDEAEPAGFLPSVDVPALRNEIENVFYPKLVEEAAARRVEDPGVFLPLMRKIVLDKSSEIIPETGHFVKNKHLFGAKREISRVLHLVIPESVWAQEYRKAAKANGIDVSFCRKDGWERELQKLLCKEELIKSGGSNPRYRYDLYENGTKDTTYVVAVPWESVRPGGDDAGKTPGNDTNGGQGGLPAALPEASGASATSTI